MGPSVVLAAAHWFQFEDSDLEDAFPATMLGQTLEVSPIVLKDFGEFEVGSAIQCVDKFFRFPVLSERSWPCRSNRLGLAMRRASPGDQLIDVWVALEAMLLGGSAGAELLGACGMVSAATDPQSVVKCVRCWTPPMICAVRPFMTTPSEIKVDPEERRPRSRLCRTLSQSVHRSFGW